MSRALLSSSLRRSVFAAARANGDCCVGSGGCSGGRLGSAARLVSAARLRGGECCTTGGCSGGVGSSGSGMRAFSSTTTSASTASATSAKTREEVLLPVRVQGQGAGTALALTVPGKAYGPFASDTYATLGGGDAAPSPVVYALASLGACNQVTGSLVARDLGIRLGQWAVDVEGQLPTAVLVHGAAGNPNWAGVTLRVRVQTDVGRGNGEDAAQARFDHFVREVERRCPITALFQQSGVPLRSEWTNEALP